MGGRDGQESREEIQREILRLPPGYISVKVINGKERYYHQWYEGGKQHTKYVRADDLQELRAAIDRRRELQERLRDLESALSVEPYRTEVAVGSDLLDYIALAEGTERRGCYARLKEYLGRRDPTVCIIYGLRRTGKTMMMYQAMQDMSDGELSRTALINVGPGDTVPDLRRDMVSLRGRGVTTVFIDEVTRMRDFTEYSYLFSDVFASAGMRVVLTGTDSLAFWLASRDYIYGRSVMIHTTHIPYREHRRLMGTEDIDDYIRYGGILRGGGMDLSDPSTYQDLTAFDTREETEAYVGLAISQNIENSLRNYRNGERFGRLYDLYRNNEFVGAVNRVVEDMNHRFLLLVLDEDFRSTDMANLMRNLQRSGKVGEEVLSHVDAEAVVMRLKETLSILDRNDRRVPLDQGHVESLREYLDDIDVMKPMPVDAEDGGLDTSVYSICVQPGLRYSQAEALVDALMADPVIWDLSIEEREAVRRMALDTVAGHILEEIVLYETQISAGRSLRPFKLLTDAGEVDMVVQDRESKVCALVEVKHSDTPHTTQTRHLRKDSITKHVESRYGRVMGRYVLYRGKACRHGDVTYLNVNDYLVGLPETAMDLVRMDGPSGRTSSTCTRRRSRRSGSPVIPICTQCRAGSRSSTRARPQR